MSARRGHVERTIDRLLGAMERAGVAERTAAVPGFLQRMDPRVKLAGLLSLIVATVFARSAAVLGAILLLAVLAALVSRVRLATLAGGVWLEAFLFTGPIAFPALVLTAGRAVLQLPLGIAVTAPGLAAAGYLLLRVETAVTLAGLLVLTTPWASVLKALRVFRVPVVFVAVLGMTYRYILLLLETTHEMFVAHRARTVAKGHGAAQLLGSSSVLLTKTMMLAEEVHLAMQARGFQGEVRLLDDFRMTPSDYVALSSFAVLAGLAVWVGR